MAETNSGSLTNETHDWALLRLYPYPDQKLHWVACNTPPKNCFGLVTNGCSPLLERLRVYQMRLAAPDAWMDLALLQTSNSGTPDPWVPLRQLWSLASCRSQNDWVPANVASACLNADWSLKPTEAVSREREMSSFDTSLWWARYTEFVCIVWGAR